MRQITKDSINAFYNKTNFKKSNTEVFYSKNQETSYLNLHGNTIAVYKHFNNSLLISSCGWKTNTTKERLNALKGVTIQQKNFVWYLNGKEWNGELTDIDK